MNVVIASFNYCFFDVRILVYRSGIMGVMLIYEPHCTEAI